MIDIEEAIEVVKKQLDEWEEEGILEEKLKEHGFKIFNAPDNTSEPTNTP